MSFRRFTALCGAGLLLAIATDCTGDDPLPAESSSAQGDGGVSPSGGGSFKLVAPPPIVVPQGETVRVPVEITRLDGFSGAVAIAIQPTPEGIAALPLRLEGSAKSADLEITATPGAPQARATVKLVATSESGLSDAHDVVIVIRGKNGARDTAFGDVQGGGTAPKEFWPTMMALTADDGIATSNGSSVVRFTSDGLPDASFGTAGRVALGKPYVDHLGSSICVLSDGKIVVGGRDVPAELNAVVHRLLPSGAYDTTFGNGGIASIPIGFGSRYILGLACDEQDRIFIGLPDQTTAGRNARFLRLTATGAVDTSFGEHSTKTGGWDIVTAANGTPTAYGGVLVAGSTTDVGFGLSRVDKQSAAAVYSGGYWRIPEVSAATIDGKGRHLIAGEGFQDVSVPNDAVIVRALGTGAPDLSLNAASSVSGVIAEQFGPTADHTSSFRGVFAQGDKIVGVGRHIGPNDLGEVVIARYLEGGGPDRTFGNDGKIVERLPDGSYVQAAVMQRKQPAVIMGASLSSGDGLLRRYWL